MNPMRWAVLALIAALTASGPAAAQSPPLVAAASDLQFALGEVAAAFTRATAEPVKLSFGSSGNFRRQIAQGAPFDLFMSADERYVAALAAEGLTVDDGVPYAVGRIVLYVPHGSPIRPEPAMADLAAALAAGRLKRLAIANPEHAPYGMAAREALQSRGLWAGVVPRLVLGENVSQAAQFAASASVEAAIIAYSLALSPNVAGRGSFALLPAELHRPLVQRMVLLKRAGPAARRFHEFVQSPPAREILARYGFALPGEPTG
jgi:molybdate transport system substrate-binding protein